MFKRERNLAVDRAVKIKEQTLGALQAKDVINAFQWCKALLNVESPQSLAVVQRCYITLGIQASAALIEDKT